MKLEADDDDPKALLFVLRAIHLKSMELPKQLTFDEVVKVAVICAKYDTVATVNWKIFVRDRVDNFAKGYGVSKGFKDGTDAPLANWYLEPGKEEWAYVAWTFGFAFQFTELAKHLIRTGRTDSEGNLLNSKSQPMNGHFPPGVIDFVLQARSASMSRLLGDTYSIFKRLLAYPTEHLCEADKQKMDRICGNFATSLTKLGLPMERPDVSAFHNSIEELVELLKKMRFDSPSDQPDIIKGTFWDHIIEHPLEDLPDAVPDEFLKHMSSQAAKW
ncbi:uncharacterized protein BDZ99DRAFT_463624 [Mytilinidion resinicola]|uniref:Uncharacterized protein n=1 Tax=Mytilinidion resinicola TaxID=574789 RepID=A0A6A6YIQ2_9PEZI|nr:uncharacterized protein BDZ99DRAFT_463624 [Mytilinidion resinicola]KAF2808736.1 hypothetical protein BDZ99DRAFT_463624 [Mytilinidion resinicola]